MKFNIKTLTYCKTTTYRYSCNNAVRIYKRDVNHLYRDSPSARYVLSEDDVQYPITSVKEEGAVRHRDFFSFHMLCRKRLVLPLAATVAATWPTPRHRRCW